MVVIVVVDCGLRKIYIEQTRTRKGIKLIQVLAENKNKNPDAMFQEACSLIGAGKAKEASQILEEIVSDGKGWDRAFQRLGLSYIIQERRQDAIPMFLKAIECNPQYPRAYSNMCLVLAEEGNPEEAIEYGKKGLAVDPSYINLYNALAFALDMLGRFDEAIDYLRKALAFKDDDLEVLKNLHGFLYKTGQKKDAERVSLRILQLVPDDVVMHRMLSQVRTYKAGDEHIRQMERLLITVPEKTDLHFALGKAYEDMGDYQQSIEHYNAGNEMHRQTFEYSSEQDEEFFEQIKQVFTKEFIEERKVSGQTKEPVFVIGMPRSSTSLVEQILASHPDVYGAGELGFVHELQFQNMNLDRANYAQAIDKLKSDDFRNMADLFLKEVDRVWNGVRFVIDKTPQNFRYLGLIKILFPKAKFIHCKRDPRDTCFSVFKHFFLNENLFFSFSQKEVVAYYKLYEELMAHWHSVLPGEIYDIHYQTLVEKPEESIRALLKYCDLEWHDGCMEFHKTKRDVRTASALQVRKPLYKGAVGYWKNYEPYIDDIVSAFA